MQATKILGLAAIAHCSRSARQPSARCSVAHHPGAARRSSRYQAERRRCTGDITAIMLAPLHRLHHPSTAPLVSATA